MSFYPLPWLLVIYFSSVLQYAAGHGYVHSVLVGGQSYPGWNPFSDPYANGPAKIVRKVANDGFVTNTDADIACHHGGNEGTAAIASAPAGSQITFQWVYWPGDHQGPVSTYMTSCNGDCSQFSANNAKWFKIDAVGYDPVSKQWAAAKLIANGASWNSTIPAGLAPGQYLVRNEIIALHSGAPQFYPSCSQVEVTGSGSGTPSENSLVSMQALYAGVAFPNIYNGPISFTIPGPPILNLAGNGGGSPSSSTTVLAVTSSGVTTRATQTSMASTPVPTGASHPSMQCNLSSKKSVRRKSA